MRTVRQTPRARSGFVLLAILWLIVALASAGLAIALTSRDAISVAQNRIDLARAQWLAEGCIAVVRANVDDQLADRMHAEATWRLLDEVIHDPSMPLDPHCDVDVRAAGMTLDVNAATAEQLRRLFTAMHFLPATVDSLVDAIEDWRDDDDEPRANGAERVWYEAEHRFLPRNGPIADVRELLRIRGLDGIGGLDSVLGPFPDRVSLAHAPRPVLAALPGFSDELVTRIIDARENRVLRLDLLSLAGTLSPAARDSLTARYAEVVPLVTGDPEAWILTVDARATGARATSTVQVRLVRGATGVALLQHRVSP